MTARGYLAFGVVAALAASTELSAQIELPRISEVIEVRVTTIDVVVTDEDGNRVRGLAVDDFDVHEDGQLREITNLSEFAAAADKAAAVAADLPPRHIVVFFDNLSTSSAERRRVSSALAPLLSDLRPVDQAMIVSWNRRLNIAVPPTSDWTILEAGLRKVSREVTRPSAHLTAFATTRPMPMEMGARIAEHTAALRRQVREELRDLGDTVGGINAILTRLTGLDGRKIVILVSSALAPQPGAEMADSAEGQAILWAEQGDGAALLRSLVSAANAAGATIYTMHAAALDSHVSAADRIDDVSVDRTPANPAIGRMRSSASSIDGLSAIATGTGGLVTANTNSFARAVERIEDDLSNYYSIGYRSPPQVRKDAERRIEVRTRDGRYRVRARKTTVQRSFEREIADRLVAALLFRPDANQLGIEAQVLKTSRTRRNRLAVPIDVKIPLAGLAFSSHGEDLAADVSIFIASADPTGSISSVEQFRQRIPVRRDQLPTLARHHYTYGMDVDLKTRSAENRLAVAVLDNLAKTTGLTVVELKPPR